tara:strand:+ start:600 stop:935 length:336 start_codon:yes stop_codon:yes gene_type:complete
MKRMRLLALALVIGTSSLFATSITDDDIPAAAVRTQMLDLFPEFEFDLNGETVVNVFFKFNSEGEIIVLRVDSRNSDIRNYVRKYMNNKKVGIPASEDRIFKLPLKLKSRY